MNRYICQDLYRAPPNPPMVVHESYFVHDNGARPFLVEISEDQSQVQVIKNTRYVYDPEILLTIRPSRVFIGEEYSPQFQNYFKGNTILLHLSGNKYMFIGPSILTFQSLAPITKYVSDMGGSNVPLPYGIDTENNYYLIMEEVILQSPPIQANQEPYDYYYRIDLIGSDKGCFPHRETLYPNFRGGIREYGIGAKTSTLRLTIKPGKNYDRLMSNPTFGNIDGQQHPTLYFLDPQKPPQTLSRQDYIDLMEEFAQLIGVQLIPKIKIIEARRW